MRIVTASHNCEDSSWRWVNPPTGTSKISNGKQTAIVICDEQDGKPVDPAEILPVEVLALILGYFPSVRSIIALQRVGKRWEAMLKVICTPSWVVHTLRIATDWCWLRTEDEAAVIDSTSHWTMFKSEARRFHNMKLGHPSSILPTTEEESRWTRWVSTYVRENYITTLAYANWDLTDVKVGIRQRKKEDLKKRPIPMNQQLGQARFVDRQTLIGSFSTKGKKKWNIQMFATATDSVVLYLNGKPQSKPRLHELVCVSTKTREILWARSILSPLQFSDRKANGQDCRLHSNYFLARWEAENIPHCSTGLLTYFVRPVIGADTNLPRIPDGDPLIITTLDLTTGNTLDELSWEVSDVGHGYHESLEYLVDMAAIADFPVEEGNIGFLKIFVYWDTAEEKWVLKVLNLQKKLVLGQCNLYTDTDYEGFYKYHRTEGNDIDLFRPIHSIFISILPALASKLKTVFITRYFTTSMTDDAINNQRVVVWTVNINLSSDHTSVTLKHAETAYKTIPTHSPLIGREYYGPTLLNPRARLAFSVRHEYQCHVQRSRGDEVAVVVISFNEQAERRYSAINAYSTVVSFWEVKEAKPLKVLSRAEAVSKFYRDRGEAARVARSGRQSVEEGRVVYEFERAEVKRVMEVWDSVIVLNDAVVWFE